MRMRMVMQVPRQLRCDRGGAATSSLAASGQSSTPSAVTRWTRLCAPPMTSPDTSLATIQSAFLARAWPWRWRRRRRSRRRSRSAGAGDRDARRGWRGCRGWAAKLELRRAGRLLELGRRRPRPASRRPRRPGSPTSAGSACFDRVGHLAARSRRRSGPRRPASASETGPAISVTRAPGCGGGGGDGEALLARRAVGDDAHRVDRLVGRAGGDEDVLAGERPGVSAASTAMPSAEHRLDPRENIRRLRQPARAIFAAGHRAFVGLEHGDAVGAQAGRRCAWSRRAATCGRSSPGRPRPACRSRAAGWWRDRRRCPRPSGRSGRRWPGRPGPGRRRG